MTTIPNPSDRILFEQIAREDEEAFRTLFDRYRQVLYGVALKLAKSGPLAEEIVQEVFISLWIARAKLPEVEKPDAYIFRILYNKISDWLRKEANRSRMLMSALQNQSSVIDNTLETLNLRESEGLIEKALELLPPQQRTVYRMSRQQGLPIPEIAEQLNISPHTVKSHLAKALAFIRTYLKGLAMVTALLIRFHDSNSF